MHPARLAWFALRCLGPRFVIQRLWLAAERRSGLARSRFASRPWRSIALRDVCTPGTPSDPAAYVDYKRRHEPAFLFPLGRPPRTPDALRRAAAMREPALVDRLKLLSQDRCIYFGRRPSPTPIDWHANPFDGLRSPVGVCWVDLPTYDPAQGDPRMLWEPARAAWALDLARARSHAADGAAGVDAGALLWRWVDSFSSACPPFEGFQWMCGQESSIRFMALAIAFWALADDPSTSPPRWVQFARLAWATGYRVARHITYAVSQKNNHAISEACGLMLIGHLFPEFREAESWRSLGRRVLAQELHRQTYGDGSYVQHSMNYQRVMLAGAVLALRIAELRGEPLDRGVYQRVGDCGEFLHQMMAPQTGRVPLYGNDDGANILPLSECEHRDYRPIVQAVHYLVHRERRLADGPWDEDLLWLFGEAALASDISPVGPPASRAYTLGGYYTLRAGRWWLMTRCCAYRDRQTQADTLHVDVWRGGCNVCPDGGTGKYYEPGRPDLESYFSSIDAHNSVEVDGRQPNERASRFQRFPWSRAALRRFDVQRRVFEGECLDYDRAPSRTLHRRALWLREGLLIVVDDLLGDGEHAAVLRWRLMDAPLRINLDDHSVVVDVEHAPFTLALDANQPLRRFEVIRGRDEPGRVQGFWSPYYGERLPCPTIEAELSGAAPLRVVTVMADAAALRLACEDDAGRRWTIEVDGTRETLELAPPERDSARVFPEVA